MNTSKYILLCLSLGLTSTVWATTEIEVVPPAKVTNSQVAGNSKIQCAGALTDLMGKRYELFESRGIDKTNPSDDVMARYLRICRNAYRPIAQLEKRLKSAGILNPQAVLRKAARADDPSEIIKANLDHTNQTEIREWRAALLSLRELSAASPKLVTAENLDSDSTH